MEHKQIQELIKAVNKSNLSELSIKDGDFEITIKQIQPSPDMQYVAMPQMPMHGMMTHMPQQNLSQTSEGLPAISADESVAAIPVAANTITVKSPMIGTFYRSAGPDKPTFINVGDDMQKGQVICIIEAMKLFNEIESEISGKIVKVLVDDATPVEYDQPLFLVEPN